MAVISVLVSCLVQKFWIPKESKTPPVGLEIYYIIAIIAQVVIARARRIT